MHAVIIQLSRLTEIVLCLGQSSHERFNSDLHTAGRNFACTDEIVTYSCSSFGSGIIVNFPPLFSGHPGFNRSDPIPSTIIIGSNSTFSIAPNAILTLTNFTAPDNDLNVNLQIRMPDFTGRFTEPVNVSCSYNFAGSPDFTTEVLPLIQESKFILIIIIEFILSCSGSN